MNGANKKVDRYPDGAWRIALVVTLENTSLEPENLFTCDIELPHTKYKVSKTTAYSPGNSGQMVFQGQTGVSYFSGFREVVAQLNTYNDSNMPRGMLYLSFVTVVSVLLLNN